MSLDEFWHGDMRLFEISQKGYFKDVSFRAWVNGQYHLTALNLALKGAFKGLEENDKYPEWEDLSEKLYKPQTKVENIEEEFRKQQCEQTNWLSNILNQK